MRAEQSGEPEKVDFIRWLNRGFHIGPKRLSGNPLFYIGQSALCQQCVVKVCVRSAYEKQLPNLIKRCLMHAWLKEQVFVPELAAKH